MLVNGASGGVGHFAVQLAVAAGAEVTAVCSDRNAAFVKELGAVEVINYALTDYTTLGRTWDVLFDCMGNRPPVSNRESLTKDGCWVLVSGPMTSEWIGPLRYMAKAFVALAFSSRRVVQFTADETAEDLAVLVEHVRAGRVTPHIEQVYALGDLGSAMERLATSRTRGELLVQVA